MKPETSPIPTPSPEAESLVSRHLLGELPEAERDAMETRLLADDGFFDDLVVAENDLVDGYVTGELSEVEREIFEKRYLASERLKARADFAAALAAAAGKKARGEDVEPAPFPTAEILPLAAPAPIAAFPSRPRFSFPLALAAAVALAASGVLVVRTISLSHQLRELTAARDAAEGSWARALDAERTQRQRLASELKEKREALAAIESKTRKPMSALNAVSFVLAMNSERGTAEPARLNIPTNADEVRLNLTLEGEDGYKAFRVLLRAKSGEEIWSQGTLQPKRAGAGMAVILPLRSGLLKPGGYELLLQGLTTEGKVEDVGYYYFDVVRK